MFEHFGKRQYQDAWVKGKLEYKGYRECENRYRLVREFIDGVPLVPKHVLDFGALFGYFSIRLSEDYEANAVAIDHNPLLVDVVEANRAPPRPNLRVQALNRKIATPEEIRALGKFDIVLVMSVLHHQVNWREMLDAFQDVALRYLFVEPPHPEEKTRNAARDIDEIHAEVSERSLQIVGESHTVYSAPQGATRTIFVLPGRGRVTSEHPYVGP